MPNAAVAGTYAEEVLARCIQGEIESRHASLLPKFPKSFGSYNFCIRKKVFKKLGGFNKSYHYASGEDNDLSYKLIESGFKICFEPEAWVKPYHPTQTVEYLKEQFRHGVWRVKNYKDQPHFTQGDDYTFWKDIVEVPLVLRILLSFLLAFVFPLVFFWLANFLGALSCAD